RGPAHEPDDGVYPRRPLRLGFDGPWQEAAGAAAGPPGCREAHSRRSGRSDFPRRHEAPDGASAHL
ncbi:unnamed protein product, partial [Symbiodinium sp. CCMP2456]